MQLTAELSLYPLREEYIPVIKAFIQDLGQRDGLTVVTNAMSTQIRGEWQQVFTAVNDTLQASAARYGKQVLVCKFIPGELDIAP